MKEKYEERRKKIICTKFQYMNVWLQLHYKTERGSQKSVFTYNACLDIRKVKLHPIDHFFVFVKVLVEGRRKVDFHSLLLNFCII